MEDEALYWHRWHLERRRLVDATIATGLAELELELGLERLEIGLELAEHICARRGYPRGLHALCAPRVLQVLVHLGAFVEAAPDHPCANPACGEPASADEDLCDRCRAHAAVAMSSGRLAP